MSEPIAFSPAFLIRLLKQQKEQAPTMDIQQRAAIQKQIEGIVNEPVPGAEPGIAGGWAGRLALGGNMPPVGGTTYAQSAEGRADIYVGPQRRGPGGRLEVWVGPMPPEPGGRYVPAGGEDQFYE